MDMRPLAVLALAAVLVSGAGAAVAQDFRQQAEANALRDIARAQDRQAEFARRQDQRESERAYRERNRYVNEKRDARSMRRFDRQ